MATPSSRSTSAAVSATCSNSVEPASSPSPSRQEPSPDNPRRAIPAAFTIPYTPITRTPLPLPSPLSGKRPHHHTGLGGGGAGGLGDGGSMASGACVSGDDGALRMVGKEKSLAQSPHHAHSQPASLLHGHLHPRISGRVQKKRGTSTYAFPDTASAYPNRSCSKTPTTTG
ncbi:hypothetical protein S40293_10996 [Stachybotrys chartarum IBT 40293]|nr:hypothetical protein S40293_10996 [Stachybotrys chartarum IBT 40293]